MGGAYCCGGGALGYIPCWNKTDTPTKTIVDTNVCTSYIGPYCNIGYLYIHVCMYVPFTLYISYEALCMAIDLIHVWCSTVYIVWRCNTGDVIILSQKVNSVKYYSLHSTALGTIQCHVTAMITNIPIPMNT